MARGLLWEYHTHADTHLYPAPPIHCGLKLLRQKVSASEHDIKLAYESKTGVDENDENQVKPSRGVIRIVLVVNVC